jgi:hypothetical protein
MLKEPAAKYPGTAFVLASLPPFLKRLESRSILAEPEHESVWRLG